jgi:GTP pyrophosphokinase
MEWEGGLKDSKEFLESLKGDVYNTELLVFTPKGEVISLAKDSTPVDFAYRIHTQVGNRCVGARINGKMVPLATVLKVGDVVEIITSNTSNGPSWDWLKFVKTNGARAKIKAFYKKEKADDMIKLGKQMLESEAKNKGYTFGELLTKENFEKLCEKFSFSGQEEMYIAVGSGALNVNQILVKLVDYYKKEHRPKVNHYPTGVTSKIVHSTGDVVIKGVDGLLVRFARCCNPVPGDKIIGFVSRGRGVVVHRCDCPNMKAEDPARFLDAEWTGKVGEDGYNVSLRITAKEDASVLSLVSTACAKYNMFILAINGRVDNKKHVSTVDITLKINKKEDLDNFLKHVTADPCVLDVFRNNN